MRRSFSFVTVTAKFRLSRWAAAILLTLGALQTGPSRAGSIPSGARPNVVVILADDLGFSDLGCYGSEIATPNLDRLADQGLRFTSFYNTARCWPSRASLLTGYYAQQVNRDPQGERPKWGALLPELLKPAGYHSYHSGKWHVDGPVLSGGFERSYHLAALCHNRPRLSSELHHTCKHPADFLVPGLWNIDRLKFFLKDFTLQRLAAIRVRRTTFGIVPGTIASVAQT